MKELVEVTDLRRPGVQHPLMGARLSLLARSLATHGKLDRTVLPLVGLMALSAVVRTPFAALEHLLFERRRRSAPPLEPPVVIVGHWRTGTTHLHNALSRSPRFGIITPIASGIPDELLTLGTWFGRLFEGALPEDRYVDRVAVDPDSPQEDEIPVANQQPLSIFHALYFPRDIRGQIDRGVFFEGVGPEDVERWKHCVRRFLEKVALHQDNPLLLIKNPVYTGRIRLLREMWPGVKIVHIRRNPYAVFASTVQYYKKLLSELALQPYDHVDVEAFVLDKYLRIMERYDAESVEMPAGQLVEVAFEDFEREPLAVLERIHVELGLDGWDEARPPIAAYLDTIGGYRKNRLAFSPELVRVVDEHWGEYVRRWGYSPPGSAAASGSESDASVSVA